MTKLRLLRVVSGITISDFAGMCHLSPSRISLIERGGLEEAAPHEVRRIASAIGANQEENARRLLEHIGPEELERRLMA